MKSTSTIVQVMSGLAWSVLLGDGVEREADRHDVLTALADHLVDVRLPVGLGVGLEVERVRLGSSVAGVDGVEDSLPR